MFAILTAGIAPALALLTFFYLKDRFEPEPLSMVFRTFLYGALLVFPIMFIQHAFETEGYGTNPFIQSFLIVGLLEEFFKWFIFLYTAFKYTEFDTAYDGIIYAVSISLGFATVENLLYLFSYGVEFAVGRAIFPVSSHALFGVIMGYYLGVAKFSRFHRNTFLFLALLIPAILHGLYDFILEAIKIGWMYLLVPFMLAMWMFGMKKVKLANQLKAEVIPLRQHKEQI
ncbi:glutamic-type intramembrane protease PrsW [Aquibacillus sp. 3ASR75-11]|uniref:Protease PrsW n=1 Tax=Terrihalobacillus insolitus TaxID=2950438 RepID=A0A9X3WST5_9BACI|nr:glutamic-type intramembrane protease PrsW [Terrihalobacillus insolitus]MDC3413073.1 glutamic-type intramembrane protease PrsW [Terrihalobacillus insolitus]MDC3424815.1 glutamic-type intramembrane protease PrsW [Terrihalobacillus insolitus]